MLVHNAANRAEHMPHWFAEVLAAVGGDEDQPTPLRPFKLGVMIIVPDHRFQRVNGSVSSHKNAAFRLALIDEVLPRQFGGHEIISTVMMLTAWRLNSLGYGCKCCMYVVPLRCGRPGFAGRSMRAPSRKWSWCHRGQARCRL